jgi:Zinc carboxypeptidase
VQLYIDIHSYSQLFMTRTLPFCLAFFKYQFNMLLNPVKLTYFSVAYGYNCNTVAPNNNVLQKLASGVSNAIRNVYGAISLHGPICTTIYQATGSSVDYVNDATKSKYTFTIELWDTGSYRFVLPASQIMPSGVETFTGFTYLFANISDGNLLINVLRRLQILSGNSRSIC